MSTAYPLSFLGRFFSAYSTTVLITVHRFCYDNIIRQGRPGPAPQKGVRIMDYRIIDVMGHVEVYDTLGNFLFSADNEAEALADLAGVA